jgi:rare lipoprotein A
MKIIRKITSIITAGFIVVGCSTPESATPEKLCTGTKRPYKVKGVWHEPQNHYEYDETGIASWYGPYFHGRPKSCGEIFNMHGVSAAHKTLPIPSVVRVTSTVTGKNVKLLIDDRGPFPPGRIIDLSKGAAIYLGVCQKGLSEVRVECLPDESKNFAEFVSRYGRYGRDPSGRTWEEIFRQEFDQTQCVPMPIRHQTSRPIAKRSYSSGNSQRSSKIRSVAYKRDMNKPRSRNENLPWDEVPAY